MADPLSSSDKIDSNSMTYEDALQNKTLIDSMYYGLQGLGEKNLPYDPKVILDTFLTKQRYIDTNLLSTGKFASAIEGLSDDQKKVLAYALQETEKLPSIFSSGSAPKGEAVADYLLAGVTDPTNIASIIASLVTFGGAAEAKLALQGAASAGAKQYLKAKLAAVMTRTVAAGVGVDAAINAGGGAAQSVIKQGAEKDLGLRSEIDPEEALLQGALEGTINPVLPIAVNILTTVPAKAAKDALSEIPAMAQAGQWIKRNLYPTAGLDTSTIRAVERTSGELRPFQEKALEIQSKLETQIKDIFGKTPSAADIDTINKYLINDPQAVANLTALNPEFRSILNDFNSLKNEAFNYGNLSNLNQKTKNIFNLDPNYVRSVPEAYYAKKREPKDLDKFLDRSPNLFQDYKQAVLRDAAQPPEDRYFGDLSSKFIDSNNRIVLPQGDVDKIILEDMQRRYATTRRLRKETAVFGQKSLQIPDPVKEIIGYNNKPALRISDTIHGIMETASRSNLAKDLGEDAIRQGVGVSARDAATARSILGKEVVPLIGGYDAKFKPIEKDVSPVKLPVNVVDPSLREYYVTKEYADQLKTLLDSTPLAVNSLNAPVLGAAMRTVLAGQNFLKAGKTVYNPMSHVRNFIGAAGYSIISGNVAGIGRTIKNFLTMSPAQRMALWDKFESLGLKGTNLDLNQVINRFGDLTDLDDGSAMSNLLGLGKLGKAARTTYGLTDDMFKFSVLLNEEEKARKIFNAFSQGTQNSKLIQFRDQIGKPFATVDDYVAEQAARNVADLTPVYSRIPRILEKMRTFPVLGSFTAYPAERLRNTYNLFKIAGRELNEGFETGNKELLKAGASRLLQWYTAQGALYTAAYSLNNYNGWDGIADKLRDYLPEWSKDGALVITGVDDKGRVKYTNLSYLHPDKDIVELVAPSILKASRGEDISPDLDKAFLNAAKKLFKPYLEASLITQAGSDMLEIIKGDYRKIPSLIKTIEPGALKMMFDMAADTGALRSMGETGSQIEQVMRPRPFGTMADSDQSFLSAMKKNGMVFPGLREETFDPQKIMGFTLSALKKNNEGNWNHFKREWGNKLADPQAVFSAESLLKDYDQSLKTQFAFQQGAKKLVGDMKFFLPEHEIFKMLNSFGMRGVKPSTKEMAAIRTGKFNPLLLSDDSNYWTAINKDLMAKTGTSYFRELTSIRNKMRDLENYYKSHTLAGDPPDLNISSEN